MGLDADSFDKRSLSSLQSQHSLQNLRMHVLKKSTSYDADTALASGVRAHPHVLDRGVMSAEARVWGALYTSNDAPRRAKTKLKVKN